MAQYKSEVLHNAYKGRLRPMNHYALGWLPRWARLAALAPGVVNGLLGIRPVAKLVLAAGGMDTRRTIPRFGRSFRAGWQGAEPGVAHRDRLDPVVAQRHRGVVADPEPPPRRD